MTLTKLFLLASFAAAPFAAHADDWPLVRGDAAMTGRSPTKLSFPLKLAWTAEIGDKKKHEGITAAAVTRDGKAWIGAQNGRFACVELATGKILWSIQKKDFFEGSAALAGDVVIAGCGDSFVYGMNAATGAEVWKFETGGEVHAGANLWKDEKGKTFVLIGSYDNKLYCLEAATGKKVWEFETANYVNGASAIYDNQVTFGGCDGMLYVLNVKTGEEIRKIEVNSYIGNNIAADKGVAYVAHYGKRVAAFNLTDGKQLWIFNERDFEYYAAPAVNEKWVIAGCRDKRLYALDRATGDKKWSFRTRGDVDSSPVICGDAHVIFGSNDGSVYAAEITDGKEVWHYEIGAPVKAPPAVAGDYVLIGSDDGGLYCFKNARP
jgi:outer membrane protein assembly factor BamB